MLCWESERGSDGEAECVIWLMILENHYILSVVGIIQICIARRSRHVWSLLGPRCNPRS